MDAELLERLHAAGRTKVRPEWGETYSWAVNSSEPFPKPTAGQAPEDWWGRTFSTILADT